MGGDQILYATEPLIPITQQFVDYIEPDQPQEQPLEVSKQPSEAFEQPTVCIVSSEDSG